MTVGSVISPPLVSNVARTMFLIALDGVVVGMCISPEEKYLLVKAYTCQGGLGPCGRREGLIGWFQYPTHGHAHPGLNFHDDSTLFQTIQGLRGECSQAGKFPCLLGSYPLWVGGNHGEHRLIG